MGYGAYSAMGSSPLFGVYLWFEGGRGGGGRGGDKNVIHIAPMPKTLVASTAFSSLCTTYCARMWSKTHCHNAQNTGIYSVFITLYNILRRDVEQDTRSQASMLLATMPKNTGIYSVLRF